MVKYILLLQILFLVGCGSLPKDPDRIPNETKIIVTEQCPEPVIKARPHLPIYDLNDSDKLEPGKVGKAYVLSIKLLQQYIVELNTILNGYKHD